MADELRCEVLGATLADGTAAADSQAEFRNDSSRTLSIREIRWAHKMDAAGAAEGAFIEISKSPTMAGRTNNNVFWTLMIAIGSPPTGATPADGDNVENGQDKWAQGQVTLEPNESLFQNTVKDGTGGSAQGNWQIYYTF